MKKIERKLRKLIASLQKHEPDVVITEQPSQNLFVANGSLDCGISPEELRHFCSEHAAGTFDIYVRIHKPYSFVHFDLIQDAITLFEQFQGCKPYSSEKNVTFYFLYVQTVPNVALTNPATSVPVGLRLEENFVSEKEELLLIQLANDCISLWPDAGSKLKNRTVLHFGYDFIYTTNEPDIEKPAKQPIPDLCRSLCERMLFHGFISALPNQITVNFYEPGQGIPLHGDNSPLIKGEVVSLSLVSDAVMSFKKDTNEHYSLILPRRSLLILKDEAKDIWKHGISSKKYDLACDGRLLKRDKRISFTFRNVGLAENSSCSKSCCDCGTNDTDQSVTDLSSVENVYVHQVYEQIADHFDQTRHSLWPGVKRFIESISNGSLLLDVGCGNGKYLLCKKDIVNVGCDRAFALCNICRSKGFNIFQADCCDLPVLDDMFDAALSIAVIHHLPTENRRRRAVEEIVRILRPGGQALIYVWAMEQRRDGNESFYLKSGKRKEYSFCNDDEYPSSAESSSRSKEIFPVHKSRQQFQSQDLLVPWKLAKSKFNKSNYDDNDKQRETLLRYYHVFKENELQSLCQQVNRCIVVESYYEQGNWCIILKKEN
ncbi:Alkylated DNA repair protein alkB -like protein 8 [Trichinella pseudospiralis]|uniref:Alkylated DNA repair protein alkB-like protein 8 n=1 Tax=Trichinella pseudospiralis TaxID=6337 RepID=A0A0V0YFL1_TRIPS|nr:Alkylated DNA repair protein alkB -like protein 8 [Trichinella pseudospiralis]KRY81838.1 Alkylated DNA repair protein alkB -like protein 8 [Trichinella pseudospiralis]